MKPYNAAPPHDGDVQKEPSALPFNVKVPPKPKLQPKSLTSPPGPQPTSTNPYFSAPGSLQCMQEAVLRMETKARMSSQPEPQTSNLAFRPAQQLSSPASVNPYYSKSEYAQYMQEQSAKHVSEVKIASQPAPQPSPLTATDQGVRIRGSSVNFGSTASDTDWEVLEPLSPQLSPFEEIPSMSDKSKWVKDVQNMTTSSQCKSSDEVTDKSQPSFRAYHDAPTKARYAARVEKQDTSRNALEATPFPITFFPEQSSARCKGPMARARAVLRTQFADAKEAQNDQNRILPAPVKTPKASLAEVQAHMRANRAKETADNNLDQARTLSKESDGARLVSVSDGAQRVADMILQPNDQQQSPQDEVHRAMGRGKESPVISMPSDTTGFTNRALLPQPLIKQHASSDIPNTSPNKDQAVSKQIEISALPPPDFVKHSKIWQDVVQLDKNWNCNQQPANGEQLAERLANLKRQYQTRVQYRAPINLSSVLEQEYHEQKCQRNKLERETQLKGNEEMVDRIPDWVDDHALWKDLVLQDKLLNPYPHPVTAFQQAQRQRRVEEKYSDVEVGDVPMTDVGPDIDTEPVGKPNQALFQAIAKELPTAYIPSETGTDPKPWIKLSRQYDVHLVSGREPITPQQRAQRTQLVRECCDQERRARSNRDAAVHLNQGSVTFSNYQPDASMAGEFLNKSNQRKPSALTSQLLVMKQSSAYLEQQKAVQDDLENQAKQKRLSILAMRTHRINEASLTALQSNSRDKKRMLEQKDEATDWIEAVATVADASQGQHPQLKRRQAVFCDSDAGEAVVNQRTGVEEAVGLEVEKILARFKRS